MLEWSQDEFAHAGKELKNSSQKDVNVDFSFLNDDSTIR